MTQNKNEAAKKKRRLVYEKNMKQKARMLNKELREQAKNLKQQEKLKKQEEKNLQKGMKEQDKIQKQQAKQQKDQLKHLKEQEKLKKQEEKKLQKGMKEQVQLNKQQAKLQKEQVKKVKEQKALLKKQLREQVLKHQKQQNFKKKHSKLQLQLLKELKQKDPRYNIEQRLLKEAIEQNKKFDPTFIDKQKRLKNAMVLKKKVTLNEMLDPRMLEEMYLINKAKNNSFNRKAKEGQKLINAYLLKKSEFQNANVLMQQINKVWEEEVNNENEYVLPETSLNNKNIPKKQKKTKKKHPDYFRAGNSPTEWEKQMMNVEEQMQMWYNVHGHNLKPKKGVKFVNKPIKVSPPKLTEAQKKYMLEQKAVKAGLLREEALKELRLRDFNPKEKPRPKVKPLKNQHYMKMKALKELEQLKDYRGKPKYLKVLKELKALGAKPKPKPKAKPKVKSLQKKPDLLKQEALDELRAAGFKPKQRAKVIVMKPKLKSRSKSSGSNSHSSSGSSVGIKMKMHIGGQELQAASPKKETSLKKKSPPKAKPVPKKVGGKFKPKAAPRQRKPKEEANHAYVLDPKTGLLKKTRHVATQIKLNMDKHAIYKMARQTKKCPFCRRKLTFIPDMVAEKITHGNWVCRNQFCKEAGFFIEGNAMYNNF